MVNGAHVFEGPANMSWEILIDIRDETPPNSDGDVWQLGRIEHIHNVIDEEQDGIPEI